MSVDRCAVPAQLKKIRVLPPQTPQQNFLEHPKSNISK